MSARDDLVEQLSEEYDLELVGPDNFHIVADHGEVLDRPIRLQLEESLFEEYVDRQWRTSGEADLAGAISLVRVHVDEAVQSAAAVGEPLVALGIRRSGMSPRPHWFEERTAPQGRPHSKAEPTLEWRA